MARYSRQDDIAVGTSIANRNHRETEELIGFFVNTLVMRTRFNAESTFRDVVREVRATALVPMLTRTCRSKPLWTRCSRIGI